MSNTEKSYTPEELAKLFSTIDGQITERRLLIHPKGEDRTLPSDIPKFAAINATRKKLASVQGPLLEKSRKIYPREKPPPPVIVNKNAIKFLGLDSGEGKEFQNYYQIPQLLRAIYAYISYKKLKVGDTIILDKKLAELYDLPEKDKNGNKTKVSNTQILSLTHKLREGKEESQKKKKKEDDEDEDEENKEENDKSKKKKLPSSVLKALENEKNLLAKIHDIHEQLKQLRIDLECFENDNENNLWDQKIPIVKENIEEIENKLSKLEKKTRFLK